MQYLFLILLGYVGWDIGSKLAQKIKTHFHMKKLAETTAKEEQSAWELETERSIAVLDESLKLTSHAVTQLKEVLGTIDKEVKAAHELIKQGTSAIDAEARAGYSDVMKRLGAFEQAFRIQDESIRQILAVINPPNQAPNPMAHYPQPPRGLSMEEQIRLAKEAALSHT